MQGAVLVTWLCRASTTMCGETIPYQKVSLLNVPVTVALRLVKYPEQHWCNIVFGLYVLRLLYKSVRIDELTDLEIQIEIQK